MKISLVVALVVAISAGSAGVYLLREPAEGPATITVAPAGAADDIPSPQYLFEHPSELKAGETKCSSAAPPSALFCSNVHKAESLRMADQYGHAGQLKGSAQ